MTMPLSTLFYTMPLAKTRTAEDPEVIDGKFRQTTYDSGRRRLFKSEKDSGVLESRAKQAMLHLTFTELRITDLESQLRKLEQDIHKLPNDFKPTKKKFPVHRHVLKRSTFDEFRLTTRSFNMPVEDQPALEVLVSEQSNQLGAKSDIDTPPSRRYTGVERAQETFHHIPETLRIRSRSLISHLERITRAPIPTKSEVDEVRGMILYSGVLVLRPFKLFVLHEKEIRQSLQEVEKLARRQTEVAGEETRDDQDFDNNDLRQDLELLIKFFDEDLKSTFDLRLKIQDGSATDIEYPDLWHLFRRGDFVMSQSNREYAYQVLNYTGGRDPRVEYRDSSNGKIHSLDGFTLDCCNLGFDGNNYVPKLEKFSIRKFPGRQPITSLPVYPLRFDLKADSLRSTFLDRGARFLQLTSSPFSHKLLTGKTLDEPSHDIDAQVVVDMTLAINTNPIWRPKTKISEGDLTEADKRETISPTSCGHQRGGEGCCGSDCIFKDLEMDELDLSTYLRENSRLLEPRKGQDLSEEERILLPHWVYGFVLRTRQWITLRIEDLSEVKFENDFDELLLPDRHKQTVQALVKTHENARSKSSTGTSSVGAGLDLVKGKGTGLIILLHGEPGRCRSSGQLQCSLTVYRCWEDINGGVCG
jgi:hypothetical protein